MLSTLLVKVMNFFRRFAAPVDCPSCHHRFKPFQDRAFTDWRDIASRSPCPKCGYQFGIGEDAKSLDANPPGKVNKPRRTRIQRYEMSSDELVFLLPPGKRGIGLIIFGVVLCAGLLPLWYHLVGSAPGFPSHVNGVGGILSLMAAASVLMLYGGLRQRFATYRIDLRPDDVRVRRDFLLRWSQRLPTRAIESVRREEAYNIVTGSDEGEREVHRHYAIAIRAGLRYLRFGSGLTEKEQLWLAQEIRAFLRAHGATGLAAELPQAKQAR